MPGGRRQEQEAGAGGRSRRQDKPFRLESGLVRPLAKAELKQTNHLHAIDFFPFEADKSAF